MKLLQINQKHLGPFAQPEHAQELINRLQALGWSVQYVADIKGVTWQFASFDQYRDFEIAFETQVEAIAGDVAMWQIEYPDAAHTGDQRRLSDGNRGRG